MSTARLGGLLLLVDGSGLSFFARPVADVSEKLDAIGSTNTMAETEATDFSVGLLRVLAAGTTVVGLFVLLVTLFG